MTIFFIIAALVLLAVIAAAMRALSHSGAIKGITGERLTEAALERELDPKSYRQIHDLTLPGRFGTIQIDHVVLSRFGVFVIESKHLFGKIVAQADGRTWTQTLGESKKATFENPLRQNPARVKALEALTGLGEGAFLPLVVVTGEGTFETGIPRGVVGLEGLADHIKRVSTVRLSEKQLDTALAAIEAARVTSPSRGTGQALVAELRERFGEPANQFLARVLKHRRQALEGLRLTALALVIVVTWGGINLIAEIGQERPEAQPRSVEGTGPVVRARSVQRLEQSQASEPADAPLPIVAPSTAFEPLPTAPASGSASASTSAPSSASDSTADGAATAASPGSAFASAPVPISTPASGLSIIIEPDPPITRPAKLGTVPPRPWEERTLSAAAQLRLFEETLSCEVTGMFRDCSCYMDEGAKVLVAEERCRSLAQYNGVRWISRPE